MKALLYSIILLEPMIDAPTLYINISYLLYLCSSLSSPVWIWSPKGFKGCKTGFENIGSKTLQASSRGIRRKKDLLSLQYHKREKEKNKKRERVFDNKSINFCKNKINEIFSLIRMSPFHENLTIIRKSWY